MASHELVSKSYNFTVRNLLKEAAQRTYGAKGVMWASMFIYLVASIAILLLGSAILYLIKENLGVQASGNFAAELIKNTQDNDLYKSGVEWVRWLLLFPMHTGILYLAVRRSVDLPLHIKQVFSTYKFYFPLLCIGLLLFSLISFSKIILQLSYHRIPDYIIFFAIIDMFITLVFSIWLTFASLLIVEKKLKILSALRTSFARFKLHWIKIILMMFFIVVPYFIIANVLLFTPTFMVVGVSQMFWVIWGVLVALLILSAIWVIPMFLNIGGILYRIMFGVSP